MEHGLDGGAVVLKILTVCVPDGGAHFFVIGRELFAPVFFHGLAGTIGFAAGGIFTDVRLGMCRRTMSHTVTDICPGSHGLGLQCLRFEQRRHFSGEYAGQVVGHGLLLHTGFCQNGECQLGICGVCRFFCRGGRTGRGPQNGQHKRCEQRQGGQQNNRFHRPSFRKHLTIG